MHNMHKIYVDTKCIMMTSNKGIKRHGKRAIIAMYKDNTQL